MILARFTEIILNQISEINKRSDNIFIVKSTIVPGTMEKLISKYSNLNKFKINKKKYQNYINNWIKPRDIENIPIWTTIIKTLDEFNKEKFK